ncbi:MULTISPECIES: DNA polymerase III subunit delta [Vitreoscilla]|uniref:DNA polymerase III subunit delta n=1 Tax=Vitreoscilla stercoraria TaxID=61 RepID=A0ABY4EEW1_VITST|nr:MULTISPECIES: DNA polymerase III subunit delta [Vitreoscilla]UOO93724.1 DNA polymerase III subunit delta [Vitreoscilla stercoraria]
MASLKQPLPAAYVVFGEEDLLRIEAVDALRAAAREQEYFDRQVLTVDSHFDWSLLREATQSMGLFSERKLIEIHLPTGKPGKEGAEALLQAAAAFAEDTVTVLVLPNMDKTQQKSKWFQAWLQAACVLECKAVSAAQLPRWIEQRLQQHQLHMAADALDVLAQRVEGNLLAAKQEIDKLALLHGAGARLGLQDAQQAVADVARFDVFDLAQSWMQGNVSRVLQLLASLQSEGDEPVLVVWAVSEDLRALLRLKAGLSSGESEQILRRNLRLWGDKYAWAQQALRRVGVRRVLMALQQCALIDRQIKGAADGKAWQSMQDLLLDLCQKTQKHS